MESFRLQILHSSKQQSYVYHQSNSLMLKTEGIQEES